MTRATLPNPGEDRSMSEAFRGNGADRIEIPPILSGEDLIAAFKAAVTPPFASKFGGKFIHEFMGERPTRDWLVKGAMTARTLFLVIGEAGCGKSFLILDLALNMALAAVDPTHSGKWFGRKIKPCGVVYIAGEGQDDFIVRIHAWLQAKGIPVDTKLPIFLIPSVVDMRSSDAPTTELMAEITNREAVCEQEFGCKFGLVVVDTLNKALAGGDDSKPESVGPFLGNCRKIIARDWAVMAVHHVPKHGGLTDPRGHSSLKGDNDGQWFVKGPLDGAPNEWKITRTKVGPTGDRHEFRLRKVAIGLDEDSEEITSCIVVPGASETSTQELEMRDAAMTAQTGKPYLTADGRSILRDNLTMIMRALHLAIEKDGQDPPYGAAVPYGRKVVTFGRWLEEICKISPGDDKGSEKFRDKCRKARDAASARLLNRGLIGTENDSVWRTSKRVAMIDRPERDSANCAVSPGHPPEFPPEDENFPKSGEGVPF